jgi:Cobalamin-5-phosphate synthase
MTLLKSALLTISMYSKIPVKQISWNESYMKYALCFLPLIGIVIGGLEIGWFFLADTLGLSVLLFSVIASIIPTLVTGGIHLDGLMDTHDALASLGDKEKRQAILKDPHSGAFAVIHCCLYFLVLLGCFAHLYENGSWVDILIISVGYIISRAICAMCIVFFPCAKESGLAYMFKSGLNKTAVTLTQCILIAIILVFMIIASPISTSIALLGILLILLHFRFVVNKKFSGISGDLAGYILIRTELVIAISVVIGLILKEVFIV